MMTARSAVQLALWIGVNHPEVFAEMYRRVTASPRGLGRLGQDDSTDDLSTVDVTASDNYIPADTSSDYSDMSEPDLGPVSVSGQYIDTTGATIDQASAESMFNLPPPPAPINVAEPTLSDVQLDPTAVNSAVTDPTITTDTSTGGGFLSSLGSGLASIGSGLLSAAGTVGSALANPTTIKALAGVAQSYFTSQAQSTALQAQVLRANAGLSPAPITYGYNAAGQLVPMMANPQTGQIAYTASGQPYYVTPQVANGLLPGATTAGLASLSNLTPYLPYLIGGGILLYFLMGSGGSSGSSGSSRPRNRGSRQ